MGKRNTRSMKDSAICGLVETVSVELYVNLLFVISTGMDSEGMIVFNHSYSVLLILYSFPRG